MYDKFYKYLIELCDNFASLSALLKRKMVALESLNVGDIDAIINEEQVFVMITRGFDQNILSHRTKLGLKGEKLSDIIEELPEEERPRFTEAFKKLKAALDEVKALQDKCRHLIEERLSSLDKAIREIDKSAGTNYSQNADSGKSGDQPHLLIKDI